MNVLPIWQHARRVVAPRLGAKPHPPCAPVLVPVQVINTGHTIQVEWKYNYGAEVSIAVPGEQQQQQQQ